MSEHETNPQRQAAAAEAAQPTAELPRAQRGQSDSTEALPSTPPAGPSDATPAPPAGTTSPEATPTGAEPREQPAPASPWQAQPASPYGQPYGGPPQSHPGQPYPGQPFLGQAQQSGPAYPGQPHHGAPRPEAGPFPPYLAGGQPSAWAQPPRPAGPNRAVKFVAAGVAALALVAGSGVAGGAVALALNDRFVVSPAGNSAPAPVINRSSLAEIAAKAQVSVVSIATGSSEGSGVILSADGHILTNNHVVDGAQRGTVTVYFSSGKSASARIVGTDAKTDLAVIRAEGVSDLVPAKFGDSDGVRVGDTVLALGSPLGLQGSVTAGIISAENRTIQASGGQENPFQPGSRPVSMSGLLQTDAPINPGNSGGALVNTNAEVIGINTAIATSGQGQGNIGVGFAIPSNKAKAIAEALRKGEKVSHPFIGVSVSRAPSGGALLGAVTSGGPADKAGLRTGDIITRFGDKPINDSNDLVAAVQAGKVGDRVTVTYTRDGDERTTTVTLAEAP